LARTLAIPFYHGREPKLGLRHRNWVHPIPNGDGQVTNYAHDLGSTRTNSSDANEEVLMVTQLDEERRRLWELAKTNLEKAHKRYKDFADKSR